MSHWNFRIMLHEFKLGDTSLPTYALHEVYYDDDSNITSWTDSAVSAQGDTWLECVDTLAMMQRAITLPVVDIRTGKPVEIPIDEIRRQESQAAQLE